MRRFLPFLVALVVVAPAHAGTFTKADTTITMSDGVPIATTFFEPTGTPPAGGWPAVIIFHGLGQTRNSTELGNVSWNDLAETYLAPQGYAVLTFDARAHGQSGGLFTLDGPRELQDTRELFAWLTAHPEIDAKHVGAFGVSYGGGNIWLSAAGGVPFAAIAVGATWTDLYEALAPQDLARSGVILGFQRDIAANKYPPELTQLLADALAERNAEAVRTFLASRSVRSQLSSITVPTFLLQGRIDFAFDVDQALVAFRALRGPKRLYLGDFGHAPAPNPPAEYPYFAKSVREWFDRFLKGAPNGIDKRPPVELAAAPWTPKTFFYPGLPPSKTLQFSLGGTSTLTASGKVVRTTARVAKLETFGTPVVRLTASTTTHYPHLVAVLSAVHRNGREILIADGGIVPPTLGRTPSRLAIRLQDEVTPIPAGSRLRVTIASTSVAQSAANPVYLNLAPAGSTATISHVSLTLPVLRKPVSP